jgi:hypothetical protein
MDHNGVFGGVPQMRPDRNGVFGGVPQMRPDHNGVFLGGGVTGPDRDPPVVRFQKKFKILFFLSLLKAREKGMANTQAGQAASEEVLDVDSKWPYLPITPTYDEYVQRYVVMPQTERDGLASVMEIDFLWYINL